MIMRSFEQKQLHSQDQLQRHFIEVYAKVPELKSLDDSISVLSVQQARKLLNGDTHALDNLKQELSALSDRKKKLLLSNGFSTDYLLPTYECNDCHDTGYVENEKCHCFKKAIIELLYTQSNLTELLELENFNTFSFDYYSNNHIDPKTGLSSLATMQKALTYCHEFVTEFGKTFSNLFMYGDTGVGKTFLSHCIAKELIESTYSVIYFTSFELFDIFEKTRFEKDKTAELMYDHIFNCDLLIIDDLGTELSNSFTTSQLFLCLNERLLRKKPTIISTNLSLDSFHDIYSERTFSRISSNYTMLRLIGDDIRIKKKLLKK